MAASLFAIPRTGADGVLEWWTELGGQPTSYADLDKDRQRRLLQTYQQRQDVISQLADELKKRDQQGAAQQLESLIGEPALTDLYSLNGEPLVIRWDTPRPLKPLPPPLVAPAAVAPIAAAVATNRGWRLAALLLGLLLLLLLLLWAWWYWRAVPVPEPVAQAPVVNSAPVSTPEPEPEPVARPEPEPVPEPVVVPEPEPAPTPAPAPVAVAVAVAVAEPAPPPSLDNYACRKDATKVETPQFVVVLDTSGSMMLNINAAKADEDWFFGDPANRYRNPNRTEQIFQPPNRMDVAADSLNATIKALDPKIDIRLITFAGCNSTPDHGVFRFDQRPRLMTGIRGLVGNDGTPLAASLEKAAGTVDGRNRDAMIVMFIDGEDGCDQDACAVSRRIAQQQPRLRVNVVNIGAGGASRCIAENTGGRTYASNNATELAKAMKLATREVSNSANCK
ncbi:VWA domain-containing protein [Pseudomonas sp. R3-18-08]|uniref:vWA domain-containing protein n=1 Tax=Pseudomonas sp. R3-18-08 TaxID=1173283 RepID=UPI00273F4275|nr:VWA domain-containing protein [Pseudomonas sp. R3-18-08]